LNARGYIAILEQDLCSTLLAFGFNLEEIIFQQDDVVVHTTKIVQEWFGKQPFCVLEWLFLTSTPMSYGHRFRGGTNRHFIHVGPPGIEVSSLSLEWLAQSPDLNPIVHMWVLLKRQLNSYSSPPSGILQL
jgi:hypothetical protein